MTELARRQFIGLAALTLAGPPGVLLAGPEDSGQTALFLSAASEPGDRHWLRAFSLDADGRPQVYFEHALPSRGHHVAVHGRMGLYAAVARRPGTWLQFGDLSDGRLVQQVDSPEGRHFLGHGIFSADGSLFYAVENDYRDMTGDSGRIAVWQLQYSGRELQVTRQGDFPSYGVGPHELLLMPDQQTLVVANGGIRTHPDSEREKLNTDTMQPSLAYIDAASGKLLEQQRMPVEYHQASIRHLDVNAQGRVAFGMQYEGLPFEEVPLVALHDRGQPLKLPAIPQWEQQQMKQYCGSVRYDGSGRYFAVSCPRGNRITFWDSLEEKYLDSVPSRDGCGICAVEEGFLYTAGTGRISLFDLNLRKTVELLDDVPTPLFWDNHLTMARI